ncbi:hypothetical protein QOT17_005193 [Balamuthia mandrillaris]
MGKRKKGTRNEMVRYLIVKTREREPCIASSPLEGYSCKEKEEPPHQLSLLFIVSGLVGVLAWSAKTSWFSFLYLANRFPGMSGKRTNLNSSVHVCFNYGLEGVGEQRKRKT